MAQSGRADSPRTLADLTNELARVRSNIEKAQKDVTAKSKELFQQQHDIEYKDPSIAKIREDIDALEKQLIAKRQELNIKVTLLPGTKAIEDQRRDLFTNLQDLQATEQAILNEIKALESTGGATQ